MSDARTHIHSGFPTYEDAVEACAMWADRNGWLDATPGGALTAAYLEAFASVADELVDELRSPPAVVICPVGNGTTIAGIASGFARRTPEAMPRHYGATTRENRLAGPLPPVTMEDWETEPLRSARPLDGPAANRGVSTSGGRFVAIDPGRLRRAQEFLEADEGVVVHPASAAPIAALEILRRSNEVASDEVVVAIITTQRP